MPNVPTLRRAVLAALLVFSLSAGAQEAPPPSHVAHIANALRESALDRAVELGEKLVSQSPDDGHAWHWLGRAYGRQAQSASMLKRPGWAGKCFDAFEKAVALDPKNVEARFDLMQYYMQAPGFLGGSEDKAREQAVEIGKLDASLGGVALGQIAINVDDDEAEAEKFFRQAIAQGGDVRRARNALANLLAQQSRWDDVRALWSAVLAEHPDDGVALFMIGRTAAVSGEQLDEGLSALDRYLALAEKPVDIGAAPAHWRRGLVLEKLGREDEAVTALQAAVAADPKFELAKKDLARLD